MKMCIGGSWVDKPVKIEVRHPFDNHLVDTVPHGDAGDVDKALAAAVRGAKVMAKLTVHERYQILMKAAQAIERRQEEFAQTITQEGGKVITESRIEAGRAVQTLQLSAEEARRLHGETVPLDASPGGAGKFGFTVRVPCGVVVAISPFNFPLNLMVHKVAPALAAGNAVVMKPPTVTPLSALKLAEVLLEAGVPAEAVSCVTGPGGELGDALCRDARVRKITFTGSVPVGERICRLAGIKRVTMELGSNAPIIVMPDADLEKVATAIAVTGYANAGQVCISTQRVIASRKVYGDLLAATKPKVAALATGNPLDEKTKVGPMIAEKEAVRVAEWVREATTGGAKLVTGGTRRGAVFVPTLLADVAPTMKISCDELFGPAVAFTPFETVDEALALANDSRYGLAAGVFTENLDTALRFARELETGNIHINWGPQWRQDLMPYGGLKESGFGKEGPRYAVEEMTELKMVCVHLKG
ncbi:MAG: Succinate-semialdehyde dehydrogenase [NADP(+)] [Verrucomicrobiae bacterium]|nr:Succinate-semialdehyde dehydrogenase [NADP(+)] [Verrucomicrobiae bacterium]